MRNQSLKTDFFASAYHFMDLNEATVPLLQRLLNREARADLYSVSAAYYLMTGRKGAWLYGDDKTMMVVARHPNLDDTLLFFPPIGDDPAELIQAATHDAQLPLLNKRLARVSESDAPYAQTLERIQIASFVEEDLLDWKYPVHVLSIDDVVSAQGHKFRDFRKNIYRAATRELSACPIQTTNDLDHVVEIVTEWAKQHVSEQYTVDDLVGPTQFAVSLFANQNLPMQGLIIYEKDEPAGYIMWEETNPAMGYASSVAGMSMKPRGTEEYAILQMCQRLQTRGFKRVCIGGSESAGLDNFKRKMCPVESVPLKSMQLFNV